MTGKTGTTTQYPKLLSIEKWSEEDVCEWLKGFREREIKITEWLFKTLKYLGIQPFVSEYLDNFRARNITGKRLATIDMSDLNDLIGSNLSHKLTIYKAINNLIQLVNSSR